MSGAGDVQISGGGAVAVDTGSLRAAADRFRSEARQLQQLAAELGWCAAQVLERTGAFGAAASEFVLRLDEDAGALSGEADRIAGRLTEAAALYEVVEQRVALEQAESQGDGHATAAAHARIGALLAEHPGIDEQADALLTAWRDEQTAQMEEIALELLPVGVPYAPSFGLPIGPAGSRQLGADVAALVAGLGFGKMRPGTTGAAPGPVTVRQLGAATAGRAPRDL
ncbi:MAG TPA: hypothetical protein VJR25_12510, partial [Microbacterium sp.]|nr:hypothetical protein [Microbacterium sp.]